MNPDNDPFSLEREKHLEGIYRLVFIRINYVRNERNAPLIVRDLFNIYYLKMFI